MGLKDSEGEEDGIVFVPCLCYLTMDTTHRKLRPYIPSLVLADWESIADSGALDDTLARSLEQEARVPSCSSSERSGTPSSGPKRRGRGSFLYIRVFCTVTSVVWKEIWMTKSLLLRADLDQRAM